ncbi:hypothetical protein ABZ307_22955 [Streptomyces griseorubiginosus]|uniref:hypothetical protein n=1 Tax=Streptomyces griseorubiginosus TaxID=67304 RepID=UPI0033B4F6E3
MALLTAGRSVSDGYRSALLPITRVVLASAAVAVALRSGFPHRMVIVGRSRRESSEGARSAHRGPRALAPHSAD